MGRSRLRSNSLSAWRSSGSGMAFRLRFTQQMSRRHHQRTKPWKVGTFLAALVLGVLTLGFGPLKSHAHPASAQTQPRPMRPLSLELSYSQLGRVLEVKGQTSPKVAVMVNGDVVPVIGEDGSFTYFTPPLPEGKNLLTVTIQDQYGQSITHQLHLEIQ